jgi:hypothetical protein
MTDNRSRLPNDSVLTDDRADRSSTVFAPMGPGPGSIVGELVNRSGDPEAGTLVPRYGGTNGLCETCLGSPDRPAQDGGHPYVPIVDRTPGVHASVDDRARTQNSRDDVGEMTFSVDDPEIASGRSAERFNQSAAKFREGQWPR